MNNSYHGYNGYKVFDVSDRAFDLAMEANSQLSTQFNSIDDISEKTQLQIIHAFQKEKISEAHLYGSTGYGYNDIGRDALERVYADVFTCEDALVRPQITCGTHALALTLSSLLRPGDEILAPAGAPYDTLSGVIGIEKNAPRGSLLEFGVTYRQVDFLADGSFDYERIKKAVHKKTKLALIQRSRGYKKRPSLSLNRIAELIAYIKAIDENIICMVDNCYGEFVEYCEPTAPNIGADIAAGSLIKNPGGGLAPTGGYIAGKKELVESVAYRLVPGLGKEVGASLGVLPSFYQGLFQAPSAVANALKSAVFAAKVYESAACKNAGVSTLPHSEELRTDIVQEIQLGKKEAVEAFCKGIQSAAPIDSHVLPQGSPMPGYGCDVIMAAGTFVSGSSIELSADAPLREPYSVFFQGGLSFWHGKLGVLKSLQALMDIGFI